MYYKKCPQNQFGELDHQKYKQIEVFYNQKYKQWLPYQILFDIVCTVNETFISLLAAGLTSYSINIVTSFICFDHSSDALGTCYGAVVSFFSLIFTVFMWLFTAKVIDVHDQSERSLLTISESTSRNFLDKARDNLRFYECYKNQARIICYMILGVVSLLLSILCLIFKSTCISFFSALLSGNKLVNETVDANIAYRIIGGMWL